ncbi:MAG: hypothetical protein AAGF97_15500 [Planctomycetota bacterium]
MTRLLSVAPLLLVATNGWAQDWDQTKEKAQVKAYFTQQQEAYAGAQHLKDAVAIAKQRLTANGQPEYAGLLDEARLQEALRSSMAAWEAEHTQREKDILRPGTTEQVKQVVARQGEHFREIAKPKYQQIADGQGWPQGSYMLVQGGNQPGQLGLTIFLIIDGRNEDGTGFELGPKLPAMKMHALELMRLSYGQVAISPNAKNDFRPIEN